MDLGMREEMRRKGMSGLMRFTAVLVSVESRRLTSKRVPSMSEQMSLHSMSLVFDFKDTPNPFVGKHKEHIPLYILCSWLIFSIFKLNQSQICPIS